MSLKKIEKAEKKNSLHTDNIIEGNKFRLQVDVKVLWIKELERKRLKDFSQKCDDPSVIAFRINENVFYVSKEVSVHTNSLQQFHFLQVLTPAILLLWNANGKL